MGYSFFIDFKFMKNLLKKAMGCAPKETARPSGAMACII
jgi:hypothetical protein